MKYELGESLNKELSFSELLEVKVCWRFNCREYFISFGYFFSLNQNEWRAAGWGDMGNLWCSALSCAGMSVCDPPQ